MQIEYTNFCPTTNFINNIWDHDDKVLKFGGIYLIHINKSSAKH